MNGLDAPVMFLGVNIVEVESPQTLVQLVSNASLEADDLAVLQEALGGDPTAGSVLKQELIALVAGTPPHRLPQLKEKLAAALSRRQTNLFGSCVIKKSDDSNIETLLGLTLEVLASPHNVATTIAKPDFVIDERQFDAIVNAYPDVYPTLADLLKKRWDDYRAALKTGNQKEAEHQKGLMVSAIRDTHPNVWGQVIARAFIALSSLTPQQPPRSDAIERARRRLTPPPIPHGKK